MATQEAVEALLKYTDS